jgi:hypothetical protein
MILLPFQCSAAGGVLLLGKLSIRDKTHHRGALRAELLRLLDTCILSVILHGYCVIGESIRNLLLQIFQMLYSAVVELLHLLIHMIDTDPVLQITLPHVILHACLLLLDFL